MDDLIYRSVVDIAQAIRNKEVSSEEVVRACIARIEAVNPKLNAVVQLVAEQAIAASKEADTALANPEFDNKIKVNFFPNPAENYLQINLGNLNTSKYAISMIDLSGKTILHKDFINPKLTELLDVSQLTKGIYLVKLESNEGDVSRKIVIQ